VSLTATDVAEILKALEASRFDSLDLEMNGVKLQLRHNQTGATALHSTRAIPPVSAAGSPVASPVRIPAAPVDAPPGATGVPSPLLGVFYRAPKPGEPSFVEVGSRVEEDSIIGIIEVMKLMNTVRAGVRGEVVGIPARNGELVEYGETLLFVRHS
jgi:acetyl-CoA carboxylase biotin carboxyl carrier protein